MKLVINYIFRSGFGVKRAITTVIGGYVSPELDLHHHFIPKEINPADAETCKHLWELYNGSQELCVEMIIKQNIRTMYANIIVFDIWFYFSL